MLESVHSGAYRHRYFQGDGIQNVGLAVAVRIQIFDCVNYRLGDGRNSKLLLLGEAPQRAFKKRRHRKL